MTAVHLTMVAPSTTAPTIRSASFETTTVS
jgi:hypothetical protein